MNRTVVERDREVFEVILIIVLIFEVIYLIIEKKQIDGTVHSKRPHPFYEKAIPPNSVPGIDALNGN